MTGNFERLVQFSPSPVALTERSGKVIATSHAFQSLLRLTPESAQGVNIDTLATWPASEPHWSHATGEASPRISDVTLWRSDGETRRARATAVTLSGPDGSGCVMHYYVPANGEWTPQSLRPPANTIDLQAFAMDATLEGMAILRNESYVYMNTAHAHMYGWEPAELIGLTWRQLYTPDVQRWIESTVFPVLQSEGRWQGEVVGLRRNGTSSPIELSLTTASDTILVCCCRDISDRRVQEKRMQGALMALDRANAVLREMDRVKDLFLASMSHELRTPLHAILGCAELLGDRHFGNLTSAQRRYVTQVTESGEHLLHLINDILDVSRIATGTVYLDPGPVPVADLLCYAARTARVLSTRKDMSVTQSTTGEGEIVWVDSRRARQILDNLVTNAVKFTAAGGTIELVTTTTPTTVSISVCDTGIGIAKEDMRRLFQPFEQVDGSLTRRYGGTGLGLYIAKSLATQSGGDLVVESEVGTGSRFTLILPRHAPAAEPGMRAPEAAR